MRQIKFRAWDKNRNRFLENGEMLLGNIVAWNNHKEFSVGYTNDYDVMQFTGLLDKNGKEIYEGDILKNTKENIIVSVIWDVSGAGWQFNEYMDFDDGVGRGDWRLTIGFAKNCEVIGNIYENQELLK